MLVVGLLGSGGGGRIILALGDTHQHIHISSHCCSASFHNSYTNTTILTSSVFKVPIQIKACDVYKVIHLSKTPTIWSVLQKIVYILVCAGVGWSV